jgi:hypothetical protein
MENKNDVKEFTKRSRVPPTKANSYKFQQFSPMGSTPKLSDIPAPFEGTSGLRGKLQGSLTLGAELNELPPNEQTENFDSGPTGKGPKESHR